MYGSQWPEISVRVNLLVLVVIEFMTMAYLLANLGGI